MDDNSINDEIDCFLDDILEELEELIYFRMHLEKSEPFSFYGTHEKDEIISREWEHIDVMKPATKLNRNYLSYANNKKNHQKFKISAGCKKLPRAEKIGFLRKIHEIPLSEKKKGKMIRKLRGSRSGGLRDVDDF